MTERSMVTTQGRPDLPVHAERSRAGTTSTTATTSRPGDIDIGLDLPRTRGAVPTDDPADGQARGRQAVVLQLNGAVATNATNDDVDDLVIWVASNTTDVGAIAERRRRINGG